jgi:poly-gamma-glutamate synthesis protein (capsule biosynthesis protein)
MTLKQRIHRFLVLALALLVVTGCRIIETQTVPGLTPVANQTSSPTPFQPLHDQLFLAGSVPQDWRDSLAKLSDIQISEGDAENALSISLDKPGDGEKEYGVFSRAYAAVVPFPTVEDEISHDSLIALWQEIPGGEVVFTQLIVSEESAAIFAEFWGGNPSGNVFVVRHDELLDKAWQSSSAVAIIPFEELTPKWKVLKIDGISPLDKPMDTASYPLILHYQLNGPITLDTQQTDLVESIVTELPATNRDEEKMTVVVMSGTTALTRTIAYKMDLKGTDYPTQDIKEWFLSADLRHVSNEVSIFPDCPEPDPWTNSLKFCTKQKYLPVLESIGVNVVELTGNHLNDYGSKVFADTIAIYQNLGWDYFGGGLNLSEAQQPLEISVNGNRIAFIGCNVAGPGSDFATEDAAGSAPCDPKVYYSTITRLKNEGYTVIATFQHHEVYVYMYDSALRKDFLDAAAAGADIVQGSQAHFPMGFEFSGDTLIHYGLGNFLFDQMDTPVEGTRRQFIDRHIIYDNQYINTEVLTALLTDWSRPVPMSSEQRLQFLKDIFQASQMR